MTFRLALQIPNFSFGTGVENLFPTVAAQAKEADAAGFDAVFVMDHFYQLPIIGAPEEPMLEAYTTLGALAAVTRRVQLGTLVTGNTYRNPTLLAKAITTLDVISAGRAILGIGTGWFELEHRQLGFEFGTFTERFAKLDEALQIILPMLKGERPTVDGRYYRTEQALAVPRFRDHIPLMIGGSGEKKTIPRAARFFDHLNLLCGFSELAHKTAVVRRCCEDIGRDPASLQTSMLLTAILTEEPAPPRSGKSADRVVAGTPAQIADQIQTKVLDAGVDGVALSVRGYRPGSVTALAETLKPLLST